METMAVLLVVEHVDIIILLLLMERLSETNEILKKWVHRNLANRVPFLHGKYSLTLVVLKLLERVLHHLLVVWDLSEEAFTHAIGHFGLVGHHVRSRG